MIGADVFAPMGVTISALASTSPSGDGRTGSHRVAASEIERELVEAIEEDVCGRWSSPAAASEYEGC